MSVDTTPALAGFMAYQIARLSTGMDGGVEVERICLVPTIRLSRHPAGPPVLPRPSQVTEQAEGVRALQGCLFAWAAIALAAGVGWGLCALLGIGG